MLKPTVIKFVIAALLGGAYFFVCSNAHIDYFPCVEVTQDMTSSSARYDSVEGLCSIMDVQRTYRAGESATLTTGGWIAAIVSFVLLPLAIAFPLGHKLANLPGAEHIKS